MKRLSKLFTKLDFLAPGVTMNIDKDGSVKTMVGSTFSILAAAGFIVSLVIAIEAFLSTKSPTVSNEQSSSVVYPILDLSPHYMFPILLPTFNGSSSIPFEEVSKFVTIVATQARYTLVPLPDGSFTYEATKAPFETKKCSDIKDPKKVNWTVINATTGIFAKSIQTDGICVEYQEGNSSVQGRGSDEIFVSIEFSIFPCTLTDASQCKTPDDLARFNFIYLTGQESLALGNYEQPLSYSFNGDEFYYIDLGLTNRLTYKLLVTEIWDAAGFLQPESLRISYPKIEQSFLQFTTRDPTQTTCTKEQIATYSCAPYFNRNFQSGGTLNKITRTYKGVVETMGDIGGARDTIFMIAMLLYGWYNERCKRKLLLESVLGLKSIPPRHQTKEEKKNLSEIEEKSFDNIEDCLDIITIAKEIHKMRLLCSILLTDKQVKSSPAFNLGNILCSEGLSRQSKVADKQRQHSRRHPDHSVIPLNSKLGDLDSSADLEKDKHTVD